MDRFPCKEPRYGTNGFFSVVASAALWGFVYPLQAFAEKDTLWKYLSWAILGIFLLLCIVAAFIAYIMDKVPLVILCLPIGTYLLVGALLSVPDPLGFLNKYWPGKRK